MKDKKNIIMVGLVIIVLIIASIISSNRKPSDNPKDYKIGLNQVTYSEYVNLLASNEPTLIFVGRPTCSHCVNFKPILEKVVNNYDLKVYYLNTDSLSNSDFNSLSSSNSYFKENEWGTPTTLLTKNNTVIDVIPGEVSESELVTFLQKNKIIK